MKIKNIFSIIFIILIISLIVLLMKYNTIHKINTCLGSGFGWNYQENVCATDEYIKECEKNWENFFDSYTHNCIDESGLETMEKAEIEKRIVTNEYKDIKHKVIKIVENEFDQGRYLYVVIERDSENPNDSCGSFHHPSIYCYFYLESGYQNDNTKPLYIGKWTTAMGGIDTKTDIKFIDKDTFWMDTAQAPSGFVTINIKTGEVYSESYDKPASERTINIPSYTGSYILEK